MLKISWWDLFQIGLLLRREDTEDPTISRGVRLLDIIAHSVEDSYNTDGNLHDLDLLEDITDITDY